MKRIYYIFIMILIYLICSSDGCTDDSTMREIREENLIVAIKDSVRNVFETDSVSVRFMRAYEETARQKLIDFADYVKIVCDTSLDINFRRQAAEMALQLFVSERVKVGDWDISDPATNQMTLEQYLDNTLSRGMTSWVRPFQISIMTPLTWKNDSTLAGTLSFHTRRIPFSDQDAVDSTSKVFVADFFVIRKEKLFGSEQLRIWEVFLGDIK